MARNIEKGSKGGDQPSTLSELRCSLLGVKNRHKGQRENDYQYLGGRKQVGEFLDFTEVQYHGIQQLIKSECDSSV